MSPENSIETVLGVEFSDKALLARALTHASYIHEHSDNARESNERLEFLGDSVLGFIVADNLYSQFPQMTEGEMTTMRAQLVSTQALSAAAREIDLGKYLTLGHGEEMSGGRTKAKNLAGALEALVAAVWLDLGLQAARDLVMRCLEARLKTVSDGGGDTDYKSRLQEITQARLQVQPRYETASMLSDTGAPVFSTKVIIGGRAMGRGTGASKREAQREAARQALERFTDT